VAEIVTVMSDETGAQNKFLSPTVLEAAYGISQAVLAAIARTGLATVNEKGETIKVPEKLKIKMYRAEIEEGGSKVISHTVLKLLEMRMEFEPERFKGLVRAPDRQTAEEEALENMVKLV